MAHQVRHNPAESRYEILRDGRVGLLDFDTADEYARYADKVRNRFIPGVV